VDPVVVVAAVATVVVAASAVELVAVLAVLDEPHEASNPTAAVATVRRRTIGRRCRDIAASCHSNLGVR
jgi:hypothetical protein